MEMVEVVIRIPKKKYKEIIEYCGVIVIDGKVIKSGTVLPKGHGRLGDLDELEQRISNFVERDAHITDEYTVARQRFIVDGIRQTQSIIEADGGDME